MITLKEAYGLLRRYIHCVHTFIGESENYYYTNCRSMVNKKTGELEKWSRPIDYAIERGAGKHCYYVQVYDDYLKEYYEDTSWRNLANKYAGISNTLHNVKDTGPEGCVSEEDYQKLVETLKTIETILYNRIINIQNNENMYCPPCVQEKADDPFYRIKPFMVKNGWTDNMTRKTWK